MPKQEKKATAQPTNIHQQLVEAVGNRDMRAVCRCLDAGADPSTSDQEGKPLIFCSSSWPITIELIKAGADVTVRDERGSTILHEAACSDETDAIDAILGRGLDIEVRDSFGETPLFDAVRGGALKAVQGLIEDGANPSAKNDEGDTPMDKVSYDDMAGFHIEFELEQAGGERGDSEEQEDEEEEEGE